MFKAAEERREDQGATSSQGPSPGGPYLTLALTFRDTCRKAPVTAAGAENEGLAARSFAAVNEINPVGDENVLELVIVVLVGQPCERAKY